MSESDKNLWLSEINQIPMREGELLFHIWNTSYWVDLIEELAMERYIYIPKVIVTCIYAGLDLVMEENER